MGATCYRATVTSATADHTEPRLIHVSAAVITDDAGRLLLVRKTGTTAFMQPGGKPELGESASQTLSRELAEELGIEGVPLRPLLTGTYEDETVRCHVHCFETTYDGVVTHADGEVVWGTWMTLPELGCLLRDPDWPFVPDTRTLLARLCREGVGDYASLGLDGTAD